MVATPQKWPKSLQICFGGSYSQSKSFKTWETVLSTFHIYETPYSLNPVFCLLYSVAKNTILYWSQVHQPQRNKCYCMPIKSDADHY